MKWNRALMALVAGLLLAFSGCVPLALSARDYFLLEPVSTLPLAPPGETAAADLRVATTGLVRLALEATVSTSSVQEDSGAGETSYRARYRFPVGYVAKDPLGVVLAREQATIAWDGPRVESAADVGSAGGSVDVRRNFDMFDPPRTGDFAVAFTLDADDTYGATLVDPKLLVFDGLSDTTWYALAGGIMVLVGLILAVVGFVFVLTAVVSDPGPRVPAPSAARAPLARDAGGAGSDRRAMWVHLSGLLGYFLPLGSILGPLGLWLAWRDGDPLVDDAGREAVNFQLSVMVYFIASGVLILVLVGIVLIIAVAVFHLAFMIVAGSRAARGEAFRYPAIIRFIR